MQKTVLSVLLFAGLLSGCHSINNTDIDKAKAAQARLTLGMAYLNTGDVLSARKNIERALSYAPEDYRTQLAMALYWQSIDERELADSRYQQALRLAPNNNGEVLNNYGAFLCSLGQYDKAFEHFERAASTESVTDITDSLENSGYCLLQVGQIKEAQEKLGRALKQDPEKGARLLKTSARYFQQQKRTEALNLLNLYSQALPDNAESVWMRIQIAASDNRPNDVQRYGEQLARDFSQSKQYQLFLAHEY